MWTDPIVEEIRAIRRKQTQEFGGDLLAILEDIRQREQKSGRVFVTFLPPNGVITPLPMPSPDTNSSSSTH
jgi:hypothetical protein